MNNINTELPWLIEAQLSAGDDLRQTEQRVQIDFRSLHANFNQN